MRKFYFKAVGFWLVLSVLAIINAVIRETTYKPWLTPYIGMWAHQISSATGILLLFGAINWFLGRVRGEYDRDDLVKTGMLWIILTIGFETVMNKYYRGLTFSEVLETYYFWRGDTWIFVLVSLVASPLIADKLLKQRKG